MSWSIKKVGSRAGVLAAILADTSIPAGVKSLVKEILDTGCPEGAEIDFQNGGKAIAHDSARVEGHGHHGIENWGGVGKLEIELFTSIPHPKLEAAPEAPPAGA